MNARLFPYASRLGFGCASLGSRIGARQGLEALVRAFDAGVNWFDLAPAYGDGAAEEIFSRFVRSRRSRIHICTKYGIAPARVGRFRQSLRPLAQRVVGAVPPLRAMVAHARGAPRRVPLATAALRAGLEGSLKRLTTDHVEVFALHDPDPEMLVTEELHRALEEVVRSGKARAVGIAGSVEAAAAALRAGLSIAHIQVPDPPFAAAAAQLAQAAGAQASYFLATHSIYGRADPVRVVVDRAGSRERLGLLLASHGYAMPLDRAVRDALVDRALAANPDGVVLLSMFSTAHLHANLARVEQGSHRAVALFEELASVRRADDAIIQCAARHHQL